MKIINYNTQLKELYFILTEVSVRQLKKQNPELEIFIDKLIRLGLDNKYLQWAVFQVKNKKNHWRFKPYDSIALNLVEYAKRFDVFAKSGKLKKAVEMNLINQAQTDIQYWHRKNMSEFEIFINNMDSYDLKSRKEVKISGSIRLYEDDNVFVYGIKNHKAATILGRNTHWCITEDDGEWWDKYVNHHGYGFAFIIDKNGNSRKNKLAKIAVQYDLVLGKVENYWDSEDEIVSKSEVGKYYKNFSRILSKIESYMSMLEPKLKKYYEDEIWYGDIVSMDGEIIKDKAIEWANGDSEIQDLLEQFYFRISGVVTSPMITDLDEDLNQKIIIYWNFDVDRFWTYDSKEYNEEVIEKFEDIISEIEDDLDEESSELNLSDIRVIFDTDDFEELINTFRGRNSRK